MPTILTTILDRKREEVSAQKLQNDLGDVVRLAKASDRPRGFAAALRQCPAPAVIAEIKRASPSRGSIREDLDPIATARSYFESGAACVSILTDRTFFGGSNEFIPEVRAKVPGIPILRKEFIIDSYQVWESRNLGADAILLIAAALSEASLRELIETSGLAELDVLLEVHNEAELLVAARCISEASLKDFTHEVMLGINNRDLQTFLLDRTTTPRLVQALDRIRLEQNTLQIPSNLLIVSESAIRTAADVLAMASAGANAFLIGEALVEKGDPGDNLKTLLQGARAQVSP